MMIKMIHEGTTEVVLYSTSAFEEAMKVKYLPCLEFATPKLRKKIEKKCLEALEEEEITRRQKWLGVYYAEELAKGLGRNVTIKWIDPVLGYGVFADQVFESGEFVGEYTGVVRKHTYFHKARGDYLFYYPTMPSKSSRFYVDAEDCGNYCRFINHSGDGNVEPCYVFSGGVIHVVLLAKKKIPMGTQICYDYGDLYWGKREDPLWIDT